MGTISVLISQNTIFAVGTKRSLGSFVQRLTENNYEESNPKIVVGENGRIWLFWLSLASRTTHILCKYFDEGKWFPVKRMYECIGDWDVAADPVKGSWLTRSSWGIVYVDYFDEQKQMKGWLISSGHLGNPSIIAFNKSSYLVWNKIISKQKSSIEASIYTNGSWSKPSIIFITSQKVRRPFILGKEKGKLLLIAQVKKNDNWDIYAGKSTRDFPSKVFLERISFSPEADTNPKGAVTEEGTYWLAWQSGKEKEENIYLSFSEDREVWAAPLLLSTSGKRNIHPTISSYQNEVYVIWQSLDEKINEWVIKGKCYKGGRRQEIEKLNEFEPIYGQNPSIDLIKDGKLLIAYDYKGEIYIGGIK